MAKNKQYQAPGTQRPPVGATVEEQTKTPETIQADQSGENEPEKIAGDQESQALADTAAAEEKRLAEEEEKAEADRQAAALLEAEQKRLEAAQKAELDRIKRKEQEDEEKRLAASRNAAKAMFEPSVSNLVAQLKSDLDQYLVDMHPTKPQTDTTLNLRQRSLHRILTTWLNAEDVNDFMAFGNYLVSKHREHRSGALSPQFVNRGFDSVQLTFPQRSLMAAVNNILHVLTDPNRQVAIASTGDVQNQVRKYLADQPTQRLVAYVKSLLS